MLDGAVKVLKRLIVSGMENKKMSLLYEMEELVPLVAELSEKYTSKESTSVSYETARQLNG